MEIHEEMKRVLYIHQSADLYGSDKVLVDTISELDRKTFDAIVALPEQGQLTSVLDRLGVESHVIPVMKVKRSMLRSKRQMINLIPEALASIIAIDNIVGGRHIDLVHSNTLAVLGGALWAKLRSIPHLWHIHEIMLTPHIISKIFQVLVHLLADGIVCNSDATRKWIMGERRYLEEKSWVIYNATRRSGKYNAERVKEFREKIGVSKSDTLLTVVGRINRWKGQSLLVDAGDILWKEGIRKVHFLFVGGTAIGHEKYRQELISRIKASEMRQKITVFNFTKDIYLVWDATDIAVVPSIEPEPFGLVAIEAMSAGKPVVAAGHGGLIEIVEHNKTGILFSPGDARSLFLALRSLILETERREEMGKKAKKRQETVFSIDGFRKKMMGVYDNLIKERT